MKKRIVSTLLALCMLLCLIPNSGFCGRQCGRAACLQL